jgi:hypothetical protein
MYRQVFTPNERDNAVVIPREWYGKEVEVIAFPMVNNSRKTEDAPAFRDQRLQEIKAITNSIHIDLSNFKFNRDEANNYQ